MMNEGKPRKYGPPAMITIPTPIHASLAVWDLDYWQILGGRYCHHRVMILITCCLVIVSRVFMCSLTYATRSAEIAFTTPLPPPTGFYKVFYPYSDFLHPSYETLFLLQSVDSAFGSERLADVFDYTTLFLFFRCF